MLFLRGNVYRVRLEMGLGVVLFLISIALFVLAGIRSIMRKGTLFFVLAVYGWHNQYSRFLLIN
jgi:hypothetical protein